MTENIFFTPIGTVEEASGPEPGAERFFDRQERIRIFPEYAEGLTGLEPGNRIMVIFHFHRIMPLLIDLFLVQKQDLPGTRIYAKPAAFAEICVERNFCHIRSSVYVNNIFPAKSEGKDPAPFPQAFPPAISANPHP